MTTDELARIAGIVLSLALAYIPGISEWYDALDSKKKVAVMGILLVVAGVGAFAASCAQLILISVTCDKEGAVQMVQLILTALIANQATYLFAVRSFKK